MTFLFLHSEPTGAPISIPAIGLDLQVRVPPEASGGTLTAIETTNRPGFGPRCTGIGRRRFSTSWKAPTGSWSTGCSSRPRPEQR
jgi:hypothetical protein